MWIEMIIFYDYNYKIFNIPGIFIGHFSPNWLHGMFIDIVPSSCCSSDHKYTTTDTSSRSVTNLPDTSSRPVTNLTDTSSRPVTYLTNTSSRPVTNLTDTSSRPVTNLTNTSSRPVTDPKCLGFGQNKLILNNNKKTNRKRI